MTTKQQIFKRAITGISEDIDGNFYTIYDPNKLFDIMVEEVINTLEIELTPSQIKKLKRHWDE